MNTDRLEELLQRIVSQNEVLISEVRDLNSTLSSVESSLSNIEAESDWIKEHSTAKRLVDAVESIQGALESFERNS
jgi:hypothetical protein